MVCLKSHHRPETGHILTLGKFYPQSVIISWHTRSLRNYTHFFAVSLFHPSFPRSPVSLCSLEEGSPTLPSPSLWVSPCGSSLPDSSASFPFSGLAGLAERAHPGLAQPGSAWLPRLHVASWAQHTHQKPPPKVSGTAEMPWDWPRRGVTKPSSPSAAPLTGGALAWFLVTHLTQGVGDRGLFVQELPGS